MRKVTDKEITRLYAFTKQHYIAYYDLQTEMVDHLANGIEERWCTQPDLSFEENLQSEFKKFGIFGFADVIEQHQKAMSKRYWRIIWQELKRQAQQPMPLSIILCLSVVVGIGLFYMPLITNIIIGVLSFASILGSLISFFAKKNYKPEKYFFDHILNQHLAIGYIPYLIYTSFNSLFNTTSLQDGQALIASICIGILTSCCLLLLYTVYVISYKKREEILKRVYPHRFSLVE